MFFFINMILYNIRSIHHGWILPVLSIPKWVLILSSVIQKAIMSAGINGAFLPSCDIISHFFKYRNYNWIIVIEINNCCLFTNVSKILQLNKVYKWYN